MSQASKHQPEHAVFTGTDAHGNYTFEVESASTNGHWYHTVVSRDGAMAVCDCPSYARRGSCSMVEQADTLVNLATIGPLVDELLSLAGGLFLSVKDDPDYVIDPATQQRVDELEARAASLLAEPGGDDGGPGLGADVPDRPSTGAGEPSAPAGID